MIYDLLAPIYDVVNGDVDYSAWADFIERIIEKEGIGCRPELVLDLGCGTGSMTIELAKRGYDMTGIDYSVEMLDIASIDIYLSSNNKIFAGSFSLEISPLALTIILSSSFNFLSCSCFNCLT